MSRRHAAKASALTMASAEELSAVRRLMLRSLLGRAIASEDAEDAVQDVFLQLARRPDVDVLLSDLDRHGGYFVNAALNAHRMRLRSEKARRAREDAHGRSTHEIRGDTEEDARGDVIDIVLTSVRLSSLQRRYLLAILRDHRSKQQIAEAEGKTTRAVDAVVHRAVEILREELNDLAE